MRTGFGLVYICMKKIMNIAVFDISSGHKKVFLNYFSVCGWNLEFFETRKGTFISKLNNFKPDVIIISSKSIRVDEINKSKHDVKIILLSNMVFKEHLKRDYCYADCILTIPFSMFRLYTEIKIQCGYCKIFPYERKVAAMLIKAGFPPVSGFQHLCTAVCICLNDTEKLFDSQSLYCAISQIVSYTPESIEHSIRRYSDIVYNNEAYLKINGNKIFNESPSNSELIAMAVDYFAQKYEIF